MQLLSFIHCISKRYHPTTNDNFNNCCPIPVILVQILLSKYAIKSWFNIPPQLFIVSPHLTQCGQGRGLPPCQVSSWPIQLFGHNTPTLQTDRIDRTDRQTDRQRSRGIGRTVLQTVTQKSRMVVAAILKNRKNAISRQRNVAQWRRSTLLTVRWLKIWNFKNSRWRRPLSLKKRKITISPQRFDRSRRNLARRRSLILLINPTVKLAKIHNDGGRRCEKLKNRHISATLGSTSRHLSLVLLPNTAILAQKVLKIHSNINMPISHYFCLWCSRIAGIPWSYRKSGSINTLATSDFKPEVEVRQFRTCALKKCQCQS